MSILNISEILFKISPVSQIETKKGKLDEIRIEENLFLAAMILYFIHLNQMMVRSWQLFSENQKEIAQETRSNHRRSEQRKAELEGQRRRVEFFWQIQFSEYKRCDIHRQASTFRFHEGEYFGEGFDHRHLQIAV